MADAAVSIAFGPPLARYSLRGRDAAVLGQLIGRKLPTRIGSSEGEVICLGPDEWLLRAAVGTKVADGAGQPLSVVEISDRAVTLVLEGQGAAEVLMAGCPRDLDKFAVGQAARTVFEGVEMIVLRTGEQRFEVEVWRSFAPWLELALSKAASHLG